MFGIELPTFSQVFGGGSLLEQAGSNLTTSGSLFGKDILRGVGELVGHVTGANALRKSLSDQASAVQQYQQRQDQLMKEEQQRRWTQDLVASRAAGTSQARAMGGFGYGGGQSFNSSDLYIGGL